MSGASIRCPDMSGPPLNRRQCTVCVLFAENWEAPQRVFVCLYSSAKQSRFPDSLHLHSRQPGAAVTMAWEVRFSRGTLMYYCYCQRFDRCCTGNACSSHACYRRTRNQNHHLETQHVLHPHPHSSFPCAAIHMDDRYPRHRCVVGRLWHR